MHNPLALLTTQLLERLCASGFQYFVRQSFPRGMDHVQTDIIEAFLITPYKDFSQVNAHFQAIKFDKRKHVYQVDLVGEKEKLTIAAGQPPGFKVFVSLLSTKKWVPPLDLYPKIKHYLRNHASWKPERGKGVNAGLFIQFGELYISIKYNHEEIKVPLDEIEKL
ncbi:hypothetical protein AAHN97_06380 [Chitinophaga niabensis]|uniref:hypothetical protein n=1 Tax=Chitinophaga niabensis TaxID=536979 RepID=UPI0031BB5478